MNQGVTFRQLPEADLRVISLGVGRQSATILHMALRGELLADVAIFADTGREPNAVYEHLGELINLTGAKLPIITVSAGNIRDDVLSDNDERFASMPFYTTNRSGNAGKLRRQCTKEYKISPIRQKVNELMGGKVRGRRVEMLMGITTDEIARVKPPNVQYITNYYPLIERRMTRHDCTLWLKRRGLSVPPKSSCIECPFHDDAYWRDLKDNSPDEFAEAVDFDKQIRRGKIRIDEDAYLHRSLVPLGKVDLSTAAENGQGDLFDSECEGHCGV